MKNKLLVCLLFPICCYSQVITYTFTEKYNFNEHLNPSSYLIGNKGSDDNENYNVVITSNSYFNYIGIEGNIRLGQRLDVDGNIEIKEASNVILEGLHLSRNDTIFNQGNLTINYFQSTDTVTMMLYPGAKVNYSREKRGNYLVGACGIGYIKLIYTANKDIISKSIDWKDYQLFDLSGKLISSGKYQLQQKYNVPKGIYILRLFNNDKFILKKIYL